MLRIRGAHQATLRARPLFSHSSRPVVGVASSATDARRTLSTSLPVATEASAAAQPYLLEPLVPYLSSLPDFLHLPDGSHKYALSIFLGTWLLRTAFTLPVTIWQRRRTRRMVEQVGPRWERIKAELPPKIRARSRRMGHPYELFQKELQVELRKELRTLTQRYKCTPLPTFIVPLAVNVPLFITVSLLLRTALILHDPAGLSSEAIPWWRPPAELQERFDASAKILAARGIEGEALAQLTKMHGPTLQDVDRTMLGPIGLGISTMANVELGQWLRRGLRGPKESEGHKKTGKKTADGKEIVEVDLGVMRESFMGNTLRVMSIVFVAISSQAPAGLVVYWLSSASYTLVQNTFLAIYDKATAKTPT